MIYKLGYLVVFFFFCACIPDEVVVEDKIGSGPVDCITPITQAEKYYQKDGDWFLWGGVDSSSHFKINNFTLDPCKLNYGLGREHFQALIDPSFTHVSNAAAQFQDHDRIIVINHNGTVKLYPLNVLRQYELVNDQINGENIMVVYCFLAELAAVYQRNYCGIPFTFGVSGYTYLDRDIEDGLESFVLWDRNTESLWWPINNNGVSGDFQGSQLFHFDQGAWEEKRWADIKGLYPQATVLLSGQSNPDSISTFHYQSCP